MLAYELKNLFVDRIAKLCGKCTIYLFGSYAYGDPSPARDIDIAVIMERSESSIAKSAELWEAFRDVPLTKDFIVASQKEFDFYKNEPGSIFKTIAERGSKLNGD
jgi:uncharacterized protein